MNRAPGPYDWWCELASLVSLRSQTLRRFQRIGLFAFVLESRSVAGSQHRSSCGGLFSKVAEPEPRTNSSKSKSKKKGGGIARPCFSPPVAPAAERLSSASKESESVVKREKTLLLNSSLASDALDLFVDGEGEEEPTPSCGF